MYKQIHSNTNYIFRVPKSIRVIILIWLLIVLVKSKDLETGEDGSILIFSQKLHKMEKGNKMPFRVTFSKLREMLNNDFISSHFIIVEVITTEIECDQENNEWDDPLDLKGTFLKAGRNDPK